MTEKQKDYLKALIAEEQDHGEFGNSELVIKALGGEYWENYYEIIPNSIVDNAIKMLKFSIHQSNWAIEHGYE